MATFRIEWLREPMGSVRQERRPLQAATWATALTEAFADLGVDVDHPRSLSCEITPDGGLKATDPATGAEVTIATEADSAEDDAKRTAELLAVLRASEDTEEATQAPTQSAPQATSDAPDPFRTAAFGSRESQEGGYAETVASATAALGERIAAASSVRRACEEALDVLLRYVPAASAAVLVHDADRHILRFLAARGPRQDALLGVKIPEDAGIAGLVMQSGATLRVQDATSDPSHYGDLDRKSGHRTGTLLAVPMRNDAGVTGVLELLNPFGGVEFADWHQALAQEAASRLAERIAAGA